MMSHWALKFESLEEHRLKRTLSDKRRMSFNVAMHYPVITVYYAAISKH